MLKFQIPSTKTVTDTKTDKRYVLYMLSVKQDRSEQDPNPALIQRRYTHFESLFVGLKNKFPKLMANVYFPKKVVLGNFNADLIYCRSAGFENLLDHICKIPVLRESRFTISFFQDLELLEAKRLLKEKKFDQALSVLEAMFALLNKVYTDRSDVVLLTLCRVVACGVNIGEDGIPEDPSLAGPTERFAKLALHRFDGVSDCDLLSLYVPLIKACISIWKVLGKDTMDLENTLHNLKRKGMRVDDALYLNHAIENLEKDKGA